MKKSLLLIIISSVVLSAISQNNPISYSMINNADLILENPEINSVSIGIYKDGKIYTGYYGEADKGKDTQPNDQSLFEIASVTKTFTGMLVAQAVLDGKLNIDDDIRKYLDGPYENLAYENRPIKIRDLLTHTSGLTRAFSATLPKMFDLEATNEEKQAIAAYKKDSLMHDLARFKLETKPGTKHDYSPIIGPEIVAIILEKVYQKSYSDLLDEFIFSKAGMSNSSTHLDIHEKKNLVNGYTDDGQLVLPLQMPMTGAGGGLKSSIPDLMKYIQYLLKNANPAIEKMKTPLFYDEEEDEQYGYFWKVDGADFMHSGGTKGCTNWLVIMPEVNSGFVVMFNSNGEKSGRLINRIANYLYDDLENYPVKNVSFAIRQALVENTDKGLAHYKQLKKENFQEYDFNDESVLNRIGYEVLSKDRIKDAIKIFELLVAEFPHSSNPYDSLGEGFAANEQYELSLKNYKKSLELNPNNENAKIMIEKIKKLVKD